MLDLNHPDTPFIFQASAHLDKLRLYWQHRVTMREEALEQSLRTEIDALETLARHKFPKKQIPVTEKLAIIRRLFDEEEATDKDFYEVIGQLEFDLGTWAI
ncbi:hypothetical protein HGH92_32245 [Chitinophaga varians]|uniref:Uncharacterized protein n=1 Tax=Chitinophaga varians TaxID=2202339 RepID=A0A847S8D3_9BACT|nr:hypothetical protein [Chitinophaga varians]NLR69017.1 hypothetical protein [Chitinophaga varians]